MIYLDHHATTPLDPVAMTAMVSVLGEHFANAGSVTHQAGRAVAEMTAASLSGIAGILGAVSDEIVITSGATESNNLALFGACLHPRQRRRKIVSLETEHRALLDPLARLKKNGFDVVLLPVSKSETSAANAAPGLVDLERLAQAIDADTAMVSVMLANNEIGVIQPMHEIAALCQRHGAVFHSDATQAVGRMPVNVDELGVDLMSFSAHKFYGPKGVGGLYVRSRERRVRLQAQIVGGGQQNNFRSGTLNTAGIIGMATALRECAEHRAEDAKRIARLRDRLLLRLRSGVPDLELNGPEPGPLRLSGNLNCGFFPVEGQSLMMAIPMLAVSSGSACTSAEPSASHVLKAIGRTEEQARSSLRFGVGRFNTEAEIDQAAEWIVAAAEKLRGML